MDRNRRLAKSRSRNGRSKFTLEIGVALPGGPSPLTFGLENMKTRTLFVSIAATLILTIWNSSNAEPEIAEKEIRQPDIAIYHIGRLYPEKTSATRRFIFIEGKSGFSLSKPSGDLIAKDVHYVKTFGALPETVEIHLLRDRFIVYPETVKDSEVADSKYNEMHAITHVYDLERGKVVESSEKYKYYSDVPLQYDFGRVLIRACRADEAEQISEGKDQLEKEN